MLVEVLGAFGMLGLSDGLYNGLSYGIPAMSVVSFKVRREIKEKMRRYRDRVNWAEELRRFVEERIRELEAEENIGKVVRELEKVPVGVSKGFASSLVREDRDSG